MEKLKKCLKSKTLIEVANKKKPIWFYEWNIVVIKSLLSFFITLISDWKRNDSTDGDRERILSRLFWKV